MDLFTAIEAAKKNHVEPAIISFFAETSPWENVGAEQSAINSVAVPYVQTATTATNQNIDDNLLENKDITCSSSEAVCSSKPSGCYKSMKNGGKTARGNLSPFALVWLQDHRQELLQSGWTAAELYRRNKSLGIVWLGLWRRADLKVSLLNDGIILFCFKEGGAPQTARPKKHTSLIGV